MIDFKIVTELTPEQLKQIAEHDKIAYFADSLPAYKYIDFYNKNSHIFLAAINENDQVIGYISLLPVTKDCYLDIKNSHKIYTNITADDVQAHDPEKNHHYAVSLFVHPIFRQYGVGKALIKKFEDTLDGPMFSDGGFITMICNVDDRKGEEILAYNKFSIVGKTRCDWFIMEKVLYKTY